MVALRHPSKCQEAAAAAPCQPAASDKYRLSVQGRVVDIVQQTWARGGVFAFFSGNEAGACSAQAVPLSTSYAATWFQQAAFEEERQKALLTRAPLCADILRTMPSKAIELSAFDLYKRLLGGRDAAGKPKGPGGAATALAGAMAGSGRVVCWVLCEALLPLHRVPQASPEACVDVALLLSRDVTALKLILRPQPAVFPALLAQRWMPREIRGLGLCI